MYDATTKVFEELDVHVDPKTVMSRMPVSQRQMVEIAKAVSYHSKVIVFDEPTSSLTEEEVEHLFRIINMLRDRGCGIIYISHKMEEILRISDEVTIMRDGQWVATRPAKELTMNEIIRLMVGRELTNRYPEKDNVVGEPILFPLRPNGEKFSAWRALTAPDVRNFWKIFSGSPQGKRGRSTCMAGGL